MEVMVSSVMGAVIALMNVFPVSLGIEELIAMERSTKCTRGQDHSCAKGSVIVDPWVNESLRYQRQLSYDAPLNYVQFLGTHNSFNNKADGYVCMYV